MPDEDGDDRQRTGRRAEQLVADRLRAQGYTILARNVRLGRNELDIIARRGSLLVVCEVRSRTTDAFGSPVETIGRKKITAIRRATARWLKENRPGTEEVRFDAAGVTFDDPVGEGRIEYFEDAF